MKFLDAVYLNERGIRFLQKGLYQNAKASFAKAVSLAGGKVQDANIRERLPQNHPLRDVDSTSSNAGQFDSQRPQHVDDNADGNSDNNAHHRQQQQQKPELQQEYHQSPSQPCHSIQQPQLHFQDEWSAVPISHSSSSAAAAAAAVRTKDDATTAAHGYVDTAPMVFRQIPSPKDPGSQRHSRIRLCVVILYNYGLAYHLHSRERCDARMQDRKRAVHLYELSCALSYQADLEMGWAYRLRIANNLGQVLRELGQVRHADGYFQDLLSCLLYLQQEMKLQGDSDGVSGARSNSILLRDEVLGGQYRIASLEPFFENLLPLILKNRGVAAAA